MQNAWAKTNFCAMFPLVRYVGIANSTSREILFRATLFIPCKMSWKDTLHIILKTPLQAASSPHVKPRTIHTMASSGTPEVVRIDGSY